MSPTSYQAAPPRENIIADARDAVKLADRDAVERFYLPSQEIYGSARKSPLSRAEIFSIGT
jgi:hypothetical protein